MKYIDILLATYNGADYLDSQLLSIMGQTYKNWTLIIHDDGSTDDTLKIIKYYQEKDPRITIVDDHIICGGAAKNFMHLLNFSKGDLVIFCDQDDIWLESKLAYLAREFDFDKPMAVFCNGYPYSEEKGIVNTKITDIYPKNLKEQLFLNAGIQGCSLMFNKNLRNRLNIMPNFVAMHDHFITLGIVCFGELKYVDRSLMLYRQFHSGKATGNIEYSFRKKIKSIFVSDIPVVDRSHLSASLSFYKAYRNTLTKSQIELFDAYFLYSKVRLLKRVYLVIKYGFSIYDSTLLLILKTFVRKPVN